MISYILAHPLAASWAPAPNLKGQTPLHLCARRNLAASAERLLSFPGVYVDAQDVYEVTPLVEAVRQEHLEVFKVLLRAKADANHFIPNCHGHGDTPLILAVRLQNADMTRALLEVPGIDLHQKSMAGAPFGKEAIDFARSGSPIFHLLKAASASQSSPPDTPAALPKAETQESSGQDGHPPSTAGSHWHSEPPRAVLMQVASRLRLIPCFCQ